MSIDAREALAEASLVLDGHKALAPSMIDYERYYVARPRVEERLIREAIRARRSKRPFHWFFTGHTGSGKSTELNRIIAEPQIHQSYIAATIDLEADFDIHNITYTDLILAMGKACAVKAEEFHCAIPEGWDKLVERWGAEIISETDRTTSKGVSISLPLIKLGDIVKAGGSRREVVRRRIHDDVIGFVRLIDQLADTIHDSTGLDLLCVLDGLDHVDTEPCLKLLNEHYETLTLSRISKVIVIPLPLLNTPFLATIGRQFSTVPNIKVFEKPGAEGLDGEGFMFYRDVIRRYVDPDLFEEDALRSLFRLSAGIVRDMIRNTGEACSYAADEGASKVTMAHVEHVWDQTMRFYRSQLHKADYEVLRAVEGQPYVQGIDGLPPLLHSKAVVFYPNGEGWYGVHPAVSRILHPKA